MPEPQIRYFRPDLSHGLLEGFKSKEAQWNHLGHFLCHKELLWLIVFVLNCHHYNTFHLKSQGKYDIASLLITYHEIASYYCYNLGTEFAFPYF
jgi:hypothetical protein